MRQQFTDAAVTLVLLFGMMVFYGFAPDWRIVFLPAFALLTVLAALGPALLMAAMNVKYRDFRYVIPFVIQFGAYVSPVGYTSDVVPNAYRLIYSLNPIVGAIDGMRWCLLRGEAAFNLPGFLVSLGVVVVMLWGGIAYFRATERTFADLI